MAIPTILARIAGGVALTARKTVQSPSWPHSPSASTFPLIPSRAS